MSKINVLISTFVLVTMLLTACSDGANATNVPGTEAPSAMPEMTATNDVAGTETVVPADGTTTPAIPVTGEDHPARLTNQLDFTVWNQNGEQIGEVDDMVLDLDNTRISYVIVGAGGFLGLAEKDVLVPWNSLKLNTAASDATGGQANAFILQADLERFKNAPSWDLNSILPRVGQPADDWDSEIRRYWESGVLPGTATPEPTSDPNMTATAVPEATATPEATEAAPVDLQGMILASDALGASIRLHGQDDRSVEVEDIIVDVETGEIQYVVVRGDFDDGEHWIPVPPGSFLWDASSESFVLNVDVANIQGAPFFQDGQFPDMTVEGWDREIAEFWQNIGTGIEIQTTPTP